MSITDVQLALANLMEAQREHDKARDDCDGTWDYFGSGHINAVDRARKEFGEALSAYIDFRVEAVLERKFRS